MSKKRGHGEGGVFQRADGLWVAQVELPRGPDGRRRRKRRTAKLKRDALDLLAEMKEDARHGRSLDVDHTTTVVDYLTNWLDTLDPTRHVDSTMTVYRHCIRHAAEVIGRKRLADLTARDVRHVHHVKHGEGLSAQYLRHIYNTLYKAFDLAERDGVMRRNPCRDVEAPKIRRRQPETFEPGEVSRILKAAQKTRCGPLFVLLAHTGLRPQEALGLRWRDVTLVESADVAGYVDVRQALRKSGTGYAPSDLKSRNAERRVPFGDSTARALRDQADRQTADRASAGETYAASDLVFTSETGTHLWPSNVRRAFESACDDAGVGYRPPQALRRTYATRLAQRGVPVKDAQQLLGHGSSSTTLRYYTGVSTSAQERAALAVEDDLKGDAA